MDKDESHKKTQEEIIKQIRSVNFGKFKKVKYKSKKRDYPAELNKYISLGITPHVFVESILPVQKGYRKASSCFSDQINFQSSLEQLELIAKGLKEDYDIYMDGIAIPFLKGCLIVFFFFKDYKDYDKIKELQEICIRESQSGSNSRFRDPELIKLWGEILGYPNCCVNYCIKTRKGNKEIEAESSKMLKKILVEEKNDAKNKSKKTREKEMDIPEEVYPNYFSYEFYPCSPQCKEARKIGENIKKKFNEEDKVLGEAFHILTNFNSKKVLNPVIDPRMGKFQNMMKDKVIHRLFSLHKELNEISEKKKKNKN